MCRSSPGVNRTEVNAFYREALRRIGELPGVERVAVGTLVPWREAGGFGPGFQFTAEGYAKVDGEEDPRGAIPYCVAGILLRLSACRSSPGVISTSRTGSDAEKVVIVSQSLAQRMFPNQDAVNRHLTWTDPVMKFIGVSPDAKTNRRRGRRHRRRERRSRSSGDGLSPVGTGDRRRPPVRARAHRSVRARDHRSRGSFASSPPISRSKRRQRWTTCAPRCWRRIDSTRSCSAALPVLRS